MALFFAILATFLGIILAACIVVGVSGEQRIDRISERRFAAETIGVAVVLYLCVNGIVVYPASGAGSDSTHSTEGAPYTEMAQTFGLEPEKEYPLQVGSRFAGSSGEVSATSGLFYARASSSWSPATALSIGFENSDGRSWILEVPVSNITFIQDEASEPSMAISLRGTNSELGFNTVKTTPPCHLAITYGWWICSPDGETTVSYRASDDAERAGLSPVITQAFAEGNATVVITLTPEQYDALLKQEG